MASCDVELVLDREDPTYRAGEPVTGSVRVTADEDLPDGKLVVQVQWRTHGRGNGSEGHPKRITLHRGGWTDGEVTEHAFELPTPDDGPLSYTGKYLFVSWYVDARAELAWKRDPEATAELLLLPGEPPDAPPEPAPFEGADRPKAGEGCLIAFGFVFAGAGLATGTMYVLHLLGRAEIEGDAWVAGFLGLAFTLVGGGIAFGAARRRIARRKLGDLTVRLDRTRLRPGDAVDVTLLLRPRGELRITGATARLHGYERCVSGSGTNKKTYTHTVHRAVQVLFDERRLAPGREAEAGASLVVPADAPTSFESTSNDLIWSVTVTVSLPGWPYWEQEYPLEVLP